MTIEEQRFIKTANITEEEFKGFQVEGHELSFSSILSHLLYSGLQKDTTLYNEIKEKYPKELQEGEEQLKNAQAQWAKEYPQD